MAPDAQTLREARRALDEERRREARSARVRERRDSNDEVPSMLETAYRVSAEAIAAFHASCATILSLKRPLPPKTLSANRPLQPKYLVLCIDQSQLPDVKRDASPTPVP